MRPFFFVIARSKRSGSVGEGQWSATGFRPRDDKGGWVCGEKKGQSLCFTLHPSIFSLLLLAFLETYTEADIVDAGAGEAVAPS